MTTVLAPPARAAAAQVRRAVREDAGGLAALLAGLSRDPAYQRFLTGLGGRPSAGLVARLLADGERGGALVAVLDGALVGHACWAHARDRTPGGPLPTAEIAVVVADSHQRSGIGSALVAGVVREVHQRGYGCVQVVTGSDNRRVQRMVARQVPAARPRPEGACVTYELRL